MMQKDAVMQKNAVLQPEIMQQDIHDIRPPVSVGMDPVWLKVFLISAGVIFVLVMAFLIYRYLKRRKQNISNELLLPPPLPPDQAAFMELDVIRPLMETHPRLFYFKLTAVLKNFVGGRFNCHAPEMTTQELSAIMGGLGFSKILSMEAVRFLTAADGIKYEGRDQKPLNTMMEKDWEFVREFVKSLSLPEAVEPVEPGKVAESVKSASSVKPAPSVKSAPPVKIAASVKPAESVKIAEHEKPTEPGMKLTKHDIKTVKSDLKPATLGIVNNKKNISESKHV